MSFLRKVELKKQFEGMGIKIEGNYVRKSEVEKFLTNKVVADIKLTDKIKETLNNFAEDLHRGAGVIKQEQGFGGELVGILNQMGVFLACIGRKEDPKRELDDIINAVYKIRQSGFFMR